MIISYALIATFMLGIYLGAAYEREEKPDCSDIFPMIWLSILWPVVLIVLIYAQIRRVRHP